MNQKPLPKGEAIQLSTLENAPLFVKIEHFINQHYDFIYNEISNQVLMKLKLSTDWEMANEYTLYRFLQHSGFDKAKIDHVRNLLGSNFVRIYNPFQEYFKTLPEWDGQDHIEKLASYLKTDDDEFFKIQFKKALVRSIACSLDGIVNRIVIVLVDTKQEIGKSYFIRWINPFGKLYYTDESIQDTNTKDASASLSENFIYNLEELEELKTKELAKMKAVVSKYMVKVRRPYAKQAESIPRRCNFWASTNKSQFLTDDRNTRWLCFNVDSIDWGYTKEIDKTKLWSQAWALYKSGFDYELTKDEKIKRDERNQEFETVNIEEDLILKHFVPVEPNDIGSSFMLNSDILSEVMTFAKGSLKFANSINISKLLKKHGFKQIETRVNGKKIRGFWIRLRSTDDFKSDFYSVPNEKIDEKIPF